MKRLNITKNDLLREIYINLGTSLSFSEKILDYLLDIIIDGLNRNNKVKISGFGTFKILDKKQRMGRNPKTGVKYLIKARRVITFYPSLNVKIELNDKK